MPLLTRKRSILAKIETTYGTDAAPSGAANAILITDPQVTPQDADLVDRDLVRDYLGNSEQLPAAISASLSFGVEVAGSGAAGTPPAWGPLMRACGLAETALASAHTGTAVAGAASTITLAAGASAVNDAYRGMTIRITGGTGAGQSRVIGTYVGATKVATLTENWATPPNATSTYAIGAQVVYQPVSTGFESVSIYTNVDGVNHRMLGARGSVAIELASRQRPLFRFTFRGLYLPVQDAALPTTVFTAFQKPLVVNKVNTPYFALHGLTGAVLERASVDLANNVVFRSLVGSESVIITDRRPRGEVTIEAVNVATKDWWTSSQNALTGAFAIEHGLTAGNIVRIDAPGAQVQPPTYSDSDGVTMMSAGMAFVPVRGNDDLVIGVS